MSLQMTAVRPENLAELQSSGWRSRGVKEELRSNLIEAMRSQQDLFPGVVGYDDTVIPEVVNGILAGHDLLFLGEKGQAKSRLMRLMVGFLDEWIPYLDIPGCPVHEDPNAPITQAGRQMLSQCSPEQIPHKPSRDKSKDPSHHSHHRKTRHRQDPDMVKQL